MGEALRGGLDAKELYDLDADPTERRNLAAAHPDQVALYERLCAGWILRTDRQFRGAAPARMR